MEMGRTEDERIVGVLHDVVEDTGWTFEALQAEGFSQEVIDALRCVTKLSEKENYKDFIERVRKNPNAYDPWTEEADAQLRQMWEEGTSVAEIAQHFGRKQSAIIVRMKKLGI